MKTKVYIILYSLLIISMSACAQNNNDPKSNMKENTEYNPLTEEEKEVILNKGTERPYSGKFYDHKEEGTYICKRCNAPLYRSDDKFDAHCGWPSFDDEIDGAVERITDADGRRTEIICANCKAHLGHVFEGEQLTDKNTRHCVNSISMEFVPQKQDDQKSTSTMDTAIFASGCFWGTEYYFEKAEGVLKVESGYVGGSKQNPTYKEVSSGNTGHAEAVRVVYDPSKTSYEQMAKLFFETHDPGQLNRQGPDIGHQYRSGIFYLNEEQKKTAEKLIDILKEKGHDVVTEISKANEFFPAEDYHQDYYAKTGGSPYCHKYEKKF